MIDLSLTGPKISRLLYSILSASGLEVTFSIAYHAGSVPELTVDFAGPDTPMLTARNGELLQAVEHLVARICEIEPEQHDLLSLDADQFKWKRDKALRDHARLAAEKVAQTSRPYTFAPMSSHERRLLHLAFASMGLHTISIGEGAQRSVVLYPAARDPSDARDPRV